jgi:hypothetical protein
MALSPTNSAAPRSPSATSFAVARLVGPSVRWTSATSAMMPPSPSLSARITNVTYLIETISVIVQKISETTP